MGKRRIRNLQHLNAGEIVGLEPMDERRKQVEKEYGIKTVSNIEEGLQENPDAFIISTPPDKHGVFAKMAAENGKNFFVEASVVLEDDIIIANGLAKKKNIVAMPSCTFRFSGVVRKVRDIVKSGSIGKVVAVHYHMGQWLPDWHPFEDIRKFYVGKRETGAGREMVPFELEWMQFIFGKVKKISCMKGKLSSLPVDIDDVYSMNVIFGDGAIGNILIDVVARYPVRRMEIVAEKGSLIMDWDKKVVEVYDPESKSWKIHKEDEIHSQKGYWASDDMYIEEMRHFVNVISGKEKLMYTMDDDIDNLNLLLTAEKSNDEGKHEVVIV